MFLNRTGIAPTKERNKERCFEPWENFGESHLTVFLTSFEIKTNSFCFPKSRVRSGVNDSRLREALRSRNSFLSDSFRGFTGCILNSIVFLTQVIANGTII